MTDNQFLQSDPAELMQAILDTQANIKRQTQAKEQLEVSLADINEQIAQDIASVGHLKQELDEAIARATNKAVEG